MFFFLSFIFLAAVAVLAFNIFGAQKVQQATTARASAKPSPAKAKLETRKEFDENGNRIIHKLSSLVNDPRPHASEEVQERERAKACSARKKAKAKHQKIELELEPEFDLKDETTLEIKKEVFDLLDSGKEPDNTSPASNDAIEPMVEHLASHSVPYIANIEPTLSLALAVESAFKKPPKIEVETKKVVTKKIKKQRKS